MSRDNLDDVLEHENLENIEIEDLQVVDEDDEIVFSIEEVEIKDMDKLKNLEDDSEDSEGADLFSLSSEFSINDDFGEINENHQFLVENNAKKQEHVELTDTLDQSCKSSQKPLVVSGLF